MNDEWVIRAAHSHELAQICSLWDKLDADSTLQPYGGDGADKALRTTALVKHSITSDDALSLVALVNGEIIGTLSSYIYDKPAVRLSRVAVLYSLWIEPEFRRQGLGRQLVSEAQSQLSAMGAQCLQVAWDSDKQDAQAFWQHEGFTSYEVIASKVLA